MLRKLLPVLSILFLLCLAVSPAAATWSPPTDTGIYGIEWNASDPSPTMQWIDADGTPISKPDFDNHVVWGNIKKVVLCDNGTVIRDINPRGDNLDLTGDTGRVMTEVPKFYARSQNASRDGHLYYRWWVSPYNATNFDLFPAFVMRGGTERDQIYVGSYEATLKVESDGILALDSRTGEQPWTGYGGSPADGMFKLAFDGGTDAPAIGATVTGNTSGTSGQVVDLYVSSGSWAADDAAGTIYLKQTDGTYTDDEPLIVSGASFAVANTPSGNAGLSFTINDAETYGENIGAGYGSINIWSYNAVRLLYHIEAGSWASQETTGLGITSKASATGFAGEETGFDSIDTNIAENGTGQGTGSAGHTSVAYRTVENLWGNSWSWITGYTSTNTEYQITKRDGTGSLSTHPLAAGSYEISDDAPLGYDGYVYGYWTALEYEDLLQYLFIPSSVTGGSYTTYGTDYRYSHNPGTRVLLAGGYWYNGRIAGVGCLTSSSAASGSYRHIGARLEFTGAATLAGSAPTANVTRNATAGNAPLAVAFTDASAGSPSWWQWDFGDGGNSTAQHPAHTYETPGTYNVTMTAWTVYGSDTVQTSVTVYDSPAANFTQNVTAGNAPLAVSFTDTSTGNVTAWSWDFGDGTNSTAQHPTHTYASPGTYTVSLNASNAYGWNVTAQTDLITALSPPAANFTIDDASPAVGQTVSFTDTSTGNVTAWSWDFGDGATSAVQSPTHSYGAAGTYTVSLNASNAYGWNVSQTSLTVGTPPVADFSVDDASPAIGQTATFTDASTNSPTSWSWAFGDGATSAVQNPTHAYTSAGTYSVSLTATNAYGTDTETKTAYIVVGNVPSAEFSATPLVAATGETVQFTDASTNSPTSWSWSFGDGATSTAQHPSHTYSSAGSYSVSLTATNEYGSSDPETKAAYIDVGNVPVADFAADDTTVAPHDTVQFTDGSTNSPSSWSWAFGDGATSTVQNPTHAYASTGTYTVTLTATNAYGTDTEIKPTYISIGNSPVAAFAADDPTVPVDTTVSFTDLSTHSPTSWSWTFGDGATSTAQNPSHAYASTGPYTVTLTATNAYGTDTATSPGYISVGVPPVASFTASPTNGTAPRTVQFTDASTNSPTSWSWDFGDGTTSTQQSPDHRFTRPGNYTVVLASMNDYGSSTAPPLAVNFTSGLRPKAVQPLSTLDEGPYDHLMAAIGGTNQLNETTEGVDFLGIKDAVEEPYTALLGSIFYAIVFALPFLMQWLRQGSMAIPSVLGIILGAIMLSATPPEYHLAAVVFIALGVLAVVWSVIKDRV